VQTGGPKLIKPKGRPDRAINHPEETERKEEGEEPGHAKSPDPHTGKTQGFDNSQGTMCDGKGKVSGAEKGKYGILIGGINRRTMR